MGDFLTTGVIGCLNKAGEFFTALGNWVLGDVHFIGFDGEKFDFKGEPDKFYNLISDFYIQVNAKFRDWNRTGDTSMEEIGMKIGTPTNYTLIQMNQHGISKFNGRKFKKKRYFPLVIRDGTGSVGFSKNFDGYKTNPEDMKFAGTFENACLTIKAGIYEFQIVRSSEPVSYEDECPYFVNLASEIKAYSRPHGIVGQTADFDGKPRIPINNQGAGIIEGEYQDYEVSSLFADDFKFNRFGKSLRRYRSR